MTRIPDFSRTAQRIEDAAGRGVANAASTLADAMRAQGLRAAANAGRVAIEGAGLVAREFGTLTRAASPVVSPIVRANAQEIVRLVATEIGDDT